MRIIVIVIIAFMHIILVNIEWRDIDVRPIRVPIPQLPTWEAPYGYDLCGGFGRRIVLYSKSESKLRVYDLDTQAEYMEMSIRCDKLLSQDNYIITTHEVDNFEKVDTIYRYDATGYCVVGKITRDAVLRDYIVKGIDPQRNVWYVCVNNERMLEMVNVDSQKIVTPYNVKRVIMDVLVDSYYEIEFQPRASKVLYEGKHGFYAIDTKKNSTKKVICEELFGLSFLKASRIDDTYIAFDGQIVAQFDVNDAVIAVTHVPREEVNPHSEFSLNLLGIYGGSGNRHSAAIYFRNGIASYYGRARMPKYRDKCKEYYLFDGKIVYQSCNEDVCLFYGDELYIIVKREKHDINDEERTNITGKKLIAIIPGTFTMGSNDGDSDEKPVHKVTLTKPFYMGATEVTQAQWKMIMGYNPSFFKGDNLPVERVTWDEAMEFCKKLTETERAKGNLPVGYEYRLPTEAEWEYCCRAGSTTKYCFGDDESRLGEYAWFDGNSGNKTRAVGKKKPNAFGLYDMHGNVDEWCLDWYADTYPSGDATDPRGPQSGSFPVSRGGSWRTYAVGCTCAGRFYRTDIKDYDLGFRFVLAPVQR